MFYEYEMSYDVKYINYRYCDIMLLWSVIINNLWSNIINDLFK